MVEQDQLPELHPIRGDRVEITDENFSEYFTDVRHGMPAKGQVMAKFSASADLVDGDMKRDVIRLLTEVEGGGTSAPTILRKFCCATQRESLRIARVLAEELQAGLKSEQHEFLEECHTVDRVAEKPYRFGLEVFYYTFRENVPVDDPHWSVIQLLDRSDIEGLLESSGVDPDVQPPNGGD